MLVLVAIIPHPDYYNNSPLSTRKKLFFKTEIRWWYSLLKPSKGFPFPTDWNPNSLPGLRKSHSQLSFFSLLPAPTALCYFLHPHHAFWLRSQHWPFLQLPLAGLLVVTDQTSHLDSLCWIFSLKIHSLPLVTLLPVPGGWPVWAPSLSSFLLCSANKECHPEVGGRNMHFSLRVVHALLSPWFHPSGITSAWLYPWTKSHRSYPGVMASVFLLLLPPFPPPSPAKSHDQNPVNTTISWTPASEVAQPACITDWQ